MIYLIVGAHKNFGSDQNIGFIPKKSFIILKNIFKFLQDKKKIRKK